MSCRFELMSENSKKSILLLKPRGFCAGVVRAIDIVRIALETFGAPIYVRKEIVHNRYVVDRLRGMGAVAAGMMLSASVFALADKALRLGQAIEVVAGAARYDVLVGPLEAARERFAAIALEPLGAPADDPSMDMPEGNDEPSRW